MDLDIFVNWVPPLLGIILESEALNGLIFKEVLVVLYIVRLEAVEDVIVICSKNEILLILIS